MALVNRSAPDPASYNERNSMPSEKREKRIRLKQRIFFYGVFSELDEAEPNARKSIVLGLFVGVQYAVDGI